MSYKKELQIAVKAAKAAGEYAESRRGKGNHVSDKGGFSLVSDVDKRCERLIKKIIKEKFPEHDFLGEEYGEVDNESDVFLWVIDPIDGTHNYVRDMPEYGISIALMYKGEVVVGVIYLPFFKELYTAVKRKGAFLNRKRIKVSNVGMKYSIVNFCTNPFQSRNKKVKNQFIDVTKIVGKMRLWGAAVVDLMTVAAGRCEGYIDMSIKPWDIAAGALIVMEAGGRVTNLNGDKWDAFCGEILATNGKIHNQIAKGFK